MTATRMAVAWCPDWPVVAWGLPLDEPVAVVTANRVVATSPAARAEGVVVGQRRRDAQGRCPEVAVVERDVEREARRFEPVALALEALTPRVEVAGPGLVGFPTRGPSRFLGGDEALAEEMVRVVTPVLAGQGEVRIGIADGTFAARLAARSTSARVGPVVLVPGCVPEFLADLPVGTLVDALDGPEVADLIDVLGRLGLTTLGRFAALDAGDVVGRFGALGRLAHRLARGLDEHPPELRRPAPDLTATWIFEPPADRIDRCAFAAKALADQLHEALEGNGMAAVRVGVEAETESGACHLRLWRHDGALSAAALAERARWQLDGWLRIRAAAREPAVDPDLDVDPDAHGTSADAIVRLSLIPDEVVPARGRQLRFWSGRAARADDVTRAVARLQGLMGAEAVQVPERHGGRGPAEQIRLVPAAAVDLGESRQAVEETWIAEPWPGAVPRPSPAAIWHDPSEIEVLDGAARPVEVDGRGQLSAPPALVALGEGRQRRTRQVVAWAGPWPADERWWDPGRHRRRARLQATLDDGSAHLFTLEAGVWSVEATYD